MDAAGNADPISARAATVYFDPEPPTAAISPIAADDPATIRVEAVDGLSGIASVEVELRRDGENAWYSLPTTGDGERFSAAVDDESFPAGRYAVRARATDRAGNEQTVVGEPIALPVRLPSALAVGQSKRVRARGTSPKPYRRILIEKPLAPYGRPLTLKGRLTSPDGNPLTFRDLQVSQRDDLPGSAWRPVAAVRTDSSGSFSYKALPGPSRLLQFRYPGSAMVQGRTAIVHLRVQATSSLRVSRKRVYNGEDVVFKGLVRGEPLPATGKLLQLQVFTRGGWRTFATPRADARGAWRYRYRFTATRGVTRYRFRARIPREAGFPYVAGRSRAVAVEVTGL